MSVEALQIEGNEAAWARAADAVATVAGFDCRALHQRISYALGRQIFFVGGAPKSGTTWLQMLLDGHPEVSCGGEGHFIGGLLPGLKTALESQNRVIIAKNQSVFRELKGFPVFGERHLFYLAAAGALLLMLEHAGGKRLRALGEKTPDNVEHFWWLLALVPMAKFIHIVRDPRDCAVSAWYHNRRVEPRWLEERFRTMQEFVRYYVDRWATGVGEGVAFGRSHPDRYLEFRYGDLLEDTEGTLSRALAFLGVEPNASAVRACCEAAAFERMSGGRPRGSEDPNSLFRKGVTGDWHNYLDPETNDYCLAAAGPLLRHFHFA